jgi:peptidyl-prolyl cis-trans isomerase C
MKKIIITLLLLLSSLSALVQSEEASKPIAIINGQTLTQQDYDDYLKARSEQTGGHDQPTMTTVVEELVNRELIRQDALKQGFDKTPEFSRELENARNSLLTRKGVRTYLETHPLDDKRLQKEYAELVLKTVPTEYKVRHILVDKEAEAVTLIKQLDAGADFATLAKEKSTDTVSADKGGDLGWIIEAQVAPQVGAALKTLAKDHHTAKPVKSQFGWHVVRVEDSRQVKPPSFESVKEKLRAMLQPQQLKEYIEQLKQTAEIKILEPTDLAKQEKDKQPAPKPTEEDK